MNAMKHTDLSAKPAIRWIMVMMLLITVPAHADMEAKDYFSGHYEEARTKFLDAAEAAGGRLEHYRNPHAGSNGEELFTDVATFNLTGARTVLVLGSGTHGVEGFAGSAIQLGLLREGITETLPDDVGLLFYHALNPYGFSQLRRFNEDNVDLNRNFVDHTEPHPPNVGYDQLAWLFDPASLSTWEDIKAKAGLAWYRITKGEQWLRSAITAGQYSHPDGIFYGGTARSWSNLTLQKITERYLSSASRVILIDVHTGLGEYGAAEAITEIFPDEPYYQWMTQCWDAPVTNPFVGDAVSPIIHGPLKRGFTEMLPDKDVIAVSLEFGTYPSPAVLWALRAENKLHHNGGWDHPDSSVIKEELKNAFYPEQDDWKRMVWRQGSQLVRQTLDCLR